MSIERWHEAMQYAKQLETKFAVPIIATVGVFEAAMEAEQVLTSLQADVATWTDRRDTARAEAEAAAEMAIRAQQAAGEQLTAHHLELGELSEQVRTARRAAQAQVLEANAQALEVMQHNEALAAARTAELQAQIETVEAQLATLQARYAEFRAKVL